MTLHEALRQRQIVLENRRQAREWFPADELTDLDEEYTKVDDLVNRLWLEQAVNGSLA